MKSIKNIIKRITAMLLAITMTVGMMPIYSFATENESVYISISDDEKYVCDNNGLPMAYYEVTFDELETIDLDDYGLGEYKYDPDGDGTPEIAALHLYIYVHEQILGYDWSEVTVTGGAGSIYFAGGLFGYLDENLRYDYNGAYPSVNGWGLTADQIVLSDGDFLNVAHYTDWSFWGDSATGFHYFTDDLTNPYENLEHAYEINVDEVLEIGFVRSYSDWMNGGLPAFAPEAEYEIYYGTTYDNATGSVMTDENGAVEISFPSAGKWYVWADGGYGAENPEAIVSAPAYAEIIVTGNGAGGDSGADDNDDGGTGGNTETSDIDTEIKVTADEGVSLRANAIFCDDCNEEVYSSDGSVLAIDEVVEWECSEHGITPDTYMYSIGVNAFPAEGYLINSVTINGTKHDIDSKDEEFSIEYLDEYSYIAENTNCVSILLLSLEETAPEDVEIYIHAEIESGDSTGENEESDKVAAAEVEKKIEVIGNVTIHSCNKIDAAREAYNTLTDNQKDLVENYTTLTSAEAAIKALYVEAAKADHTSIYNETEKYLGKLGTPNVGSTGGEWMVIGLTRSGNECPEGYYENVVTYVEEHINEKEQLHKAKGTDNSRVIIGLTAAGYDVTNVGGHNLLMGLTDMEYVKYQGINGPIWALIAFDCYNYEIPTNADAVEQVTRDKLINYILNSQLDDGGWALSGKIADPDMTGMAIQSLAPYYNENEDVKIAIDKAVECLSEKQYSNGGFGSIEGSCSESCAQVIVALTTLGINPETDERFVKNGVSVVDAMCLFAVKGGGFVHVPGGSFNGMATEQSFYALTAYYRFLNGKTSLYDMSEVSIKNNVEAVKDMIDAIGNVTIDSGNLIKAARLVYDGLSAEEQKKVSNIDKLIDAEALYKDVEAAYKVISLINAIGKVTADSVDKVTAARKAYNALTVAQKKLVTNYSMLTEAESELKADSKVQNVIDLIEAIGNVTVNSETRIKKARVAYDALTTAQKKLVDNYKTLLIAEVDLNLAKIDYVEDLIDSIGEVSATASCKTKISRARTAYNKLTAELKAEVTNYDILVAAEETYKKLAATITKPSTAKKPVTATTIVEDLTTYSLSVNELIESITTDSLEGEILDAILAYEELTEEEKAALGKDRTIESLKTQFAEVVQIDSKTGITLSGADWNIALVVDDVLDLTQAMYLQGKLGNNAMLAIWDIYLEDMLTDKEYQPDGSVLVKIPLAQIGDYSAYDGLAVVHFAADCTVEYLNSMIMGEYLVFNTVDFSNYAVVGYYGDAPADGVMTAAANNADASANMSWIPWTVGGVVGIAALVLILVMQKKNKKVNVGE